MFVSNQASFDEQPANRNWRIEIEIAIQRSSRSRNQVEFSLIQLRKGLQKKTQQTESICIHVFTEL